VLLLQEAGIYQTPVEQQARHLETELARDALKHKLEAADRPTAEELTAQGILHSKQHDMERLLAAAQVSATETITITLLQLDEQLWLVQVRAVRS
jgi:hypothetical protein